MSDEVKHTPGEWKAVPDLQGRFQIETPHGSIAWLSLAGDRAAEIEVEANARLIAAAPDYDAAVGPAITALAFAQEDAQRRGDAVAFAQYTAAKDGLIAAQNKARGREPEMLDITPPRTDITKASAQ